MISNVHVLSTAALYIHFWCFMTGKNIASLLYVFTITLTWALTWKLNSVSATCWGSFNRQKQHEKTQCYGNPTLIPSNRVTHDYWLHKCFSLGLSWLGYFLQYNISVMIQVQWMKSDINRNCYAVGCESKNIQYNLKMIFLTKPTFCYTTRWSPALP